MSRVVVPAFALAAALVVACQPSSSAPSATSSAPRATSASPSAVPNASAAPTAAAWRRIADIPTARSEVAAVVSSQLGKVFVIGGQGSPQRVETDDAAADRWERAPDLPLGVDHAMAAVSEGLQSAAPQGVFVFGGHLGNGTPTARSFRFDPTGARWEEIAPMPGPRRTSEALGGATFGVAFEAGRLLPLETAVALAQAMPG